LLYIMDLETCRFPRLPTDSAEEPLDKYPDKFAKYALKDTEVTLKLFFLLQQALNDLAYELAENKKVKRFKLYRTLASAGVESFTNNNGWFDDYRNELRGLHTAGTQLIERSYYGGRNEGYFVGRTGNYPETRNKVWIDIDFKGCYPTAMALCPKIDFKGAIKYIPRTYHITSEIEALLIKDKVPKEEIALMREALSNSPEDFDKAMMKMKNKRTSWKIREKASAFNNEIIDDWYRRWTAAKKDKGKSIDHFLIPGFARIQFKFPDDTQFPCLPIRHYLYGLIYVLEGETVATASEIMLAMDIKGTEIRALTSIEYPIILEDNLPDRFLLKHLSMLATKRDAYKKKKDKQSSVMEKLIKEFTNSLYGKLAQAINPRNVYNPATGEMKRLGGSTISEPCTATLTTSLARAALSAALLGVEQFNKKSPHDQITVISATTDGLLIGLPTKENFTALDEYYQTNPLKLKSSVESDLPQILKDFGCSELLQEIDKFLPIRQMHKARFDMTSNKAILEIKHIADEIISIKTRGQIGRLVSGETVLLARFNLKPPLSEILTKEKYKATMEGPEIEKNTIEANWIIEHLDKIDQGNNEIQKYNFITLSKFPAIYKSNGKLDLTKKVSHRIINFNYDWKRRLTWSNKEDYLYNNTSPVTTPYKTTKEMLRLRDKTRKIQKAGFIALPGEVLKRVAISKAPFNLRGGQPAAITRLFLRALTHNMIEVQEKAASYSIAAEKINKIWGLTGLTKSYPKKWTKVDFKNASQAEWQPIFLTPDRATRELVVDIAIEFKADPDTTIETIFGTSEVEEPNKRLLGYIITALAQAPQYGIYPFAELQEKGLLPSWEHLQPIFSEYFTEDQIDTYAEQHFIPGEQPSYNVKSIEKLFRQVGIPKEYSKLCARCLAPISVNIHSKHRNPSMITCTKHFIHAIMQQDIITAPLKSSLIITKLGFYGLTKHIFYEEKRKRFSPNCLPNTQDNRLQIYKMAKSLGIDAVPLIDVLIE